MGSRSGKKSKMNRKWWNMIDRCGNPKAKGYKNYGGRGIKVCYEWHNSNPEGYQNFKKWLLSQGYDPTLPRGVQTLDRIDVDGDYSPANCRLISSLEQNGNTRKNIYLTYNGETHHLAEWARRIGVSTTCMSKRVRRCRNVEEILSPIKAPTNKHYEFDYNGKHYTKLVDVAKDYSLSPSYLSQLINRKGYKIIEAIEYLRMRLQENLSTEAPTSMPKKKELNG